jgi:radical SAM superfamily enzyme YgiQ (UPF0313 family)
MKLLLVTPPMTQLNTPYPATAYLTGFLRSRGMDVVQADPALVWVLRLLSHDGLARLGAFMAASTRRRTPAVRHFLAQADTIARQMPIVLALLQGRDASMAQRIAARRYLMEGPRFANIGPQGHEEEYLQWAFGTMGLVDKARYFATLFLEDVADAIREGVDPHFDFARYGEGLAQSQPTLDPLLDALAAPSTPCDAMLRELTQDLLREHQPQVVGMTLPFPGNVLGALRMAQTIRQVAPAVKILWGGGYVNTELRELSEPRLFDWVDAVSYDDGEAPLLRLLQRYAGAEAVPLLRTRLRERGAVRLVSDPGAEDVPFKDTGTPTYAGLPLGEYLAMFDVLNPMHRLWSDTRWNKLTVAHGCYWKKCSFCDITLSYISHYSPLAARTLVDRIEALVAETGSRGFHFVDEAAPPAALKAMADELLARGLEISWWANIRFEKTFTPELCALLARAGCIAVSGGLEVASNRLLALMQKGVTVEQVACVAQAFTEAGVLVHAYLMYGFPSQTAQETVDSLEMVRQLFEVGCLDSAFWHRFAATAHSPIGQNPDTFGIALLDAPAVTFGKNDLPFLDPHGADPARFSAGLKKAVYNYMHGMGYDTDVRAWFDGSVPKPTVSPFFIKKALKAAKRTATRAS